MKVKQYCDVSYCVMFREVDEEELKDKWLCEEHREEKDGMDTGRHT